MDRISNFEIEKAEADVNTHGKLIDSIVDKLVTHYTKPLDDLLDVVRERLDFQDSVDFSDEEFEKLALKIPTLLYFASDGKELVGVRQDVSKLLEKEKYNRLVLTSVGKVAEKQGYAATNTLADSIITIASNRAYKRIEGKITAGYELLNSVKKVLSNRIVGKELSNGDKN